MTHVELEIPDDVAKKLRERAEKLGMSVPRYVAEIVRRDVAAGWPPRFFQDVVGAWKGAPLERPPQGELETRDDL
jgi:hypothetical protein